MFMSQRRYNLRLSTFLLLISCQVATPFIRSHVSFATRLWYCDRLKSHATQLYSFQFSPNVRPDDDMASMNPSSVEAPLKYLGPYPCLTLKFPDLATASQRQRNVSGIELDFVLDTAANTNTIQETVPLELKLPKIGNSLPGLGVTGAIRGGNTYLLGDCQLVNHQLKEADIFTFMTNLSASSIPFASPAATAGLLGTDFFNCFEGGVEFRWSGSATTENQSFPDDARVTLPSVVFHSRLLSCNLEGLHPIKITPLDVTCLPSIQILVNGVPMKALLDTGSPITVLNVEAARIANVAAKAGNDDVHNLNKQGSSNPLLAAVQSFQKNAAKARAVGSQDILLVAGPGKAVELVKSAHPVSLGALSTSNGPILVPLAQIPVYIGDLPGLAALGGLGSSAAPAVILGMDVLRCKKRMIYLTREVYFD